jgi:competence protein ComEA
VGLYTRRQLLLLLGLVAAGALGVALGHWRNAHPDLAARLESFDQASHGVHGVPGEAAALDPPSRVGAAAAPSPASAHGSPASAGGAGGGASGNGAAGGAGSPDRPEHDGDRRDRPGRGRPGHPITPIKLGATLPGEPPPGPIDVNRASADDLTRLPGIGPALAARIVEARATGGPFSTLDDLARVRGLGRARLDLLRPYVSIGE